MPERAAAVAMKGRRSESILSRQYFCKANDREGGEGNETSRYQSHKEIKYAIPDSTRGLIGDGPLRADHRRLCMLCWPARASDVLIHPLIFPHI